MTLSNPHKFWCLDSYDNQSRSFNDFGIRAIIVYCLRRPSADTDRPYWNEFDYNNYWPRGADWKAQAW